MFPYHNRNITFVYDETLHFTVKCQSINLYIDGQSEPRAHKISLTERGTSYVYRFILNLEKEELFYPWLSHQVFFAVHSPFVPINPFLDGRAMKPGYLYNVNIRLEKELLLPHPYQTNCTDYEAMWKKNNKTGPRSQQKCRDMCTKNYSKFCFGCEKGLTMYENIEDLCSPLERCGRHHCYCKDLHVLLKNKGECIDNCKEECL
ncbi:uncharacterized protein TNCV_2400181 [Trichonephila clavipes]|uniref:Uncharacterized protein n=1 Tax=Trichonephila clavipes TaxID=2585209 RepID=A0A8X6VRY8_TRICX|nr:uncharacterized protein TNCV_2400181 [Trichonephila clavipes]